MTGPLDRLPERLVTALAGGSPALLLTVGADGLPASAFTWAVALDDRTVRFAADHGTSTLANLERERRAALQVIAGGGLVFLVKGVAEELKRRIEASPFPMALWQLRIRSAKDQSWPGVVVRPLEYEWSADRRAHMLAMERAVLDEMKTASA